MNRRILTSFLLLGAAACSDDPIAPFKPTATGQITVNASANWAYVRFQGDTVALAEGITSPTTSTAWHMAFFGTNVMLNGGAAGPGNVKAYCLCANEAATTTELQAMTPASELSDFEQVTVANIPDASLFQSDVLVPVVLGWYHGSGAGAMANADSSWVLAKGDASTGTFAKFRVVSIAGATATAPGTVNFEYATEPSHGAAFSAVQSRSVTVGATPVYFNLASGTTTTATGDWDIEFDGFDIRLNSGVSGTGTVKGLSGGNQFSTLTVAAIQGIPPQAYKTDSYGGVFATKPWYKYNITGTDNLIWPKYNVYLISTGSQVFKVQLIGYYSSTGVSRHITMRYSRIK